MSTKIGPKTVSQRDRSKALVFCIDAANSDSYGGEPTTNVFPDPEPAGNFSISQAGGSAGTISYGSEDGIPHLVISNTTANSGTDYPRVNFLDLTSTVTDGFSISFEAKADDEGKVLKFALYSGVSTRTTQTANLTTEWKKFTFNNITTGYTLDDGYLRPNETYSGNKYIRRIQVEQKTSSTPFTATSRTASNAVKNISGVGALGTTLTGTFAAYGQELFKPTNRRVLASFNINQGHIGGAYWDFDGTDEYISAGTGIMTSELVTISVWVKYGGNSGLSSLQGMVTNNNTSGGRRDFNVSANKFQFVQKNFSNGRAETSEANGPDEGVWTHAVATSKTVGSDTLSKIYKNGIEVASNTYSSVTMASGLNDACHIGYLNLSRYFNGEIACVSVWSSCLTDKEIKDIYISQKGRFGK
tara:strand:+ start:928 stop:2172 length:1245 start_codon:yes stop_codon:yes gene_type:complete